MGVFGTSTAARSIAARNLAVLFEDNHRTPYGRLDAVIFHSLHRMAPAQISEEL